MERARIGNGRKYLNGECFNEFTGIDLLEYSKDYNEKLLEKCNNNLSKEKLLSILETLRELFESKSIKQINYSLLMLVIEYRIIYDKKTPDIPFDKYVIENLRQNDNYKEYIIIDKSDLIC